MNKQQQDIIDEAYENYCNEYLLDNSIGLCLLVARVDGKSTYRKPSKEMFVDLCTYDSEFIEKWGLMICERNLSDDELIKLVEEKVKNHQPFKNEDFPKKVITVTYKNKTVESYEN